MSALFVVEKRGDGNKFVVVVVAIVVVDLVALSPHAEVMTGAIAILKRSGRD